MKNLDLKISPLANQQLDEFYAYCSISYGCKKADTIYVLIKRTFNDFCIFPGMGQIEPLLSDYPQCFRSFTQHPNTKIIYWVEDNAVKIALLFYTRQAPEKLRYTIENRTDWICEPPSPPYGEQK
ncbi:hypothetical protein [uncultured Parabacteroides sp.]|uniref:type II toxin-antitoxin system RelE/ParE family toxin n=1 Tax=uncultured Parabacteroides sp. TaxID=512312 RepID=UPI00262F2DB5|nr:hypothetical protein [uncultured Parabacteroides sp.]